MTDQPKTLEDAVRKEMMSQLINCEPEWNYAAIAQAAIQASGLVEAMNEIVDLCPATCEISIAHTMAQIAQDALAKLRGQTNG